MDLNIIKTEILNSDVITFDIFDTLLIRPYINPSHLLEHIEQSLSLEGFAQARRLASKIARKNSSKEDITFDEIYRNMPEKFQSYKETELLFERKVLKQNPKIYELYKFALENNKKIAFISDMYLPKTFLKEVLAENGYTHFDYFYLSSEEGVVKHTGNLFRKFLSETKLEPSKILHIGDDKISDKKRPEELGIKAVLIPKISEQFFKTNPIYKKLYKKNKKSLTISIILALLAEKYTSKNIEDNYFYNFGYRYGGAIGYGFAKFISDEAEKKNIDELLFIARDGYLLEKIVKLLSPQKNTFYVYAQRVLKAKLNIDNQSLSEPTEAISNYKNYLLSLGINFDKEVLVIDTGASSFSAQRIIEKVIGKKLLALYTIVAKEENIEKYNISCKTWAKQNEILNITSLIEFIFMSPEPPVCDLQNGKPVYINPLPEEIVRNKLCPIISAGILDFVSDISNRLNDLDICFSPVEINEYIKTFCLNLSKEDKQMLGSVYYASNNTHTLYKYSVLRLICKLSKHPKYILDRIRFKLMADFKCKKNMLPEKAFALKTKKQKVQI